MQCEIDGCIQDALGNFYGPDRVRHYCQIHRPGRDYRRYFCEHYSHGDTTHYYFARSPRVGTETIFDCCGSRYFDPACNHECDRCVCRVVNCEEVENVCMTYITPMITQPRCYDHRTTRYCGIYGCGTSCNVDRREISTFYINCEDCGSPIFYNPMCYHTRRPSCCSPDDSDYCSECDEERGYCECDGGENYRGIYNYSHKPDWNFWRVPPVDRAKKTIYYGVELELDSSRKSRRWHKSDPLADAAKKDTVRIFAKEDASCSAAEFVSHPMSWNYIKSNRNLFQNILNLKRYGYKSAGSGNCGLHVHISRKLLSKLDIAKIIKIWMGEGPSQLIQEVSGRGIKGDIRGFRYCPTKLSGTPCQKVTQNYGGRDAVNLINRGTVEIRVLRGSLHPVVFFGRLGLVPASVEFVKKHSYRECTLQNLCLWVLNSGSAKKTYPDTFKYLNVARIKKHLHPKLQPELKLKPKPKNPRGPQLNTTEIPNFRAELVRSRLNSFFAECGADNGWVPIDEPEVGRNE